MKVARYHGADSRVIRLLEDKPKDKLKATGGRDAWDEKLHASRKAAAKDAWCDCCVSVICGIQYHCETYLNFELCYKCYLSREVIHPPTHPFTPIGPEYTTESEASDSNSEKKEDEEEKEEEEDNEEEGECE